MTKSANIDIAQSNMATAASVKKTGRLKDLLSVASTALPIAGALGTLAVWLAATFYVGEIQVTPDRPFNTLEVRVSDKKGQESVFHTPHFQLMPGQYHLEVTVDSQFKHHADIKAAFHKHTDIPVHVPEAVAGSSAKANSDSSTTGSNTVTGNSTSTQTSSQAGVATAQPIDEDWGAEPGDNSKKHWWQFWRKSAPDK